MADDTITTSPPAASAEDTPNNEPVGRSLVERASRGPVTPAAAVAKADAITTSYNEFHSLVRPAENRLAEEKERISKHITEYSRSKTPQDRKRDIANEQDYARRKIVDGTDEKRWAHLRTMQRHLEELEATAELFSSPAQIVMSAGLGTEERERYRQDCASSGPMELRTFAAIATATKNRALAACILNRLDGMDKREREQVGISRQELAEAVGGDEYRRVQGALQRARDTFKAAMARNRSFQSGKKLNPLTRIGIGVRRPMRDGDSLEQPGGREAD